jgi:uncharacterized protein (TIGR02118 family)
MADDIEKDDEPTNPARRDVLTGSVTAAVGGAVLVASGGTAGAAENAKGDRCLTSVFPSGEGAKFDLDYYTDHHIPLVLSLYGTSISKYEVFQGQPGADGSPPPFLAMSNIWIADEKAFAEASRKHAKDFSPDIPNFTNIKGRRQNNVLYRVIKS